MSARRAASLALLAVLGAFAAVPAVSLGSASGAAAAPAVGSPAVGALADAAANGSNASLGTHLSAFVTTGVESAGENVERGMWEAAYESSDDRSERAALVSQRTSDIEQRLADLEAERRELVRMRRNDEIEPVVFRARMSALATQLSELRRSINDTEPRAAAVGMPDAVADLRRQARNASTPGLRRARSLGGGPPDGTPPGRNGAPPGRDGAPPGQGPGEGPPGNGTDTGQSGNRPGGPPGSDTPAEECRGGPPDQTRDDGSSDGNEGRADC